MFQRLLNTFIFLNVIICTIHSQTYTVNQQSQQVNINVPIIEKPVYIERYRTVYVDKPRTAKKLSKPVLLLGYLWVYPEDLGNFKQVPVNVIKAINNQKPYGHNNWRIPTPDELAVMEANADIIGLGDDIYLATDHRNGVLRLVAIEGEDLKKNNYVKVGDTYWLKYNLGAKSANELGAEVSYEDALKYCPEGHRLPTKKEFEELLTWNLAHFQEIDNNYDADLFFPAGKCGTVYMNETYRICASYLIAKDYYGNFYYVYFDRYCDAGYWTTHRPKIEKGKTTGYVRYVRDK